MKKLFALIFAFAFVLTGFFATYASLSLPAFADEENINEAPSDESGKETDENKNTEETKKAISDAEKYSRISSNCDQIKTQLKNVQKEDSRLRVNLGAYYENVSTQYMQNLNLRLVKNELANPTLSSQQTEFASLREEFRRDFVSYSQDLEKVLATNCKDNAEDFYGKLKKARTKRREVREDIKRLNLLVSSHLSTIDGLIKEFEDER